MGKWQNSIFLNSEWTEQVVKIYNRWIDNIILQPCKKTNSLCHIEWTCDPNPPTIFLIICYLMFLGHVLFFLNYAAKVLPEPLIILLHVYT